MLVQEDEAGGGRNGGLERQDDAEDMGRQPPQRLELERPRQRRRKQADADRGADELCVAQVMPGRDDPPRRHQQRAERHRGRKPGRAAPDAPDAHAEQDVERPEETGDGREHDPERLGRAAAAVREQRDAHRREDDPDEVARLARAEHGDRERPEKLDRDDDAERRRSSAS